LIFLINFQPKFTVANSRTQQVL